MTEQEAVCLSICAMGEDMLAIGSWEEPIKRLAERGLLARVGSGYRITAAGEAAHVAYNENAEIRAVAGAHNARLSYQCPHCRAVSYNPNDRLNRYCGRCHQFADDVIEGEAIWRDQ